MEGYTINNYGAKIYRNPRKQPILNLVDGSNVYHVLSIESYAIPDDILEDMNKIQSTMMFAGFAKYIIITVEIDGEAKAYLAPSIFMILYNECKNRMLHGENVFPADIEIVKLMDEYQINFIKEE